MTEKELSAMKVDELRKMATAAGIKGSKKYKKDELISMLIAADEKPDNAEPEANVEQADPPAEVGPKVTIDHEGKRKRIERIEVGTIVAFETEDGKVKSAKVVNKSSKNEKLKLETSYGREYIVPYDAIVWVRTGARWPRGVYNLLKGNENGQETSNGIESEK